MSESYMHRYAKTTLGSWLNRKASKKLPHILNDIFIPTSQNYKIYYEYPICSDKHGNIIGLDKPWTNKIPSYRQLKNNKDLNILFIFDVVYFEDNSIKYIYEICYKSPITDKKINFLKKYNLECYELSAQDILDKSFPPKNISYLNHIG
jgi:hypothetical protein